MNILLLLALTIWSPSPDQGYHGPANHTYSQAHYQRRLNRLQARRYHRTKHSKGRLHPSLIHF